MAAAAHFGMEQVRKLLNLAPHQVRRAVATGLLARDPQTKSFDRAQVEHVAADPGEFTAALASEQLLNATQAARRLGVSPGRFARAAREAQLPVKRTKDIVYFGRRCTVRYFRALDVDSLAPRFPTDTTSGDRKPKLSARSAQSESAASQES